ncbi:MAG: GxxExxY protein [Pirellulaceae bacterium]
MPIEIDANLRCYSQDEFGRVAYNVMGHVFAIHNEMGRFFNESIYRNALARRIGDQGRSEVLIKVQFDDFSFKYFLDLLVCEGAVFELKVASQLTARHRAQLVNYLLLCELNHGKLINFRPEKVEHEFLNTSLTRAERTNFQVDDQSRLERDFVMWFIAFLRDVGTCLELQLYEQAASYFFGGDDVVVQTIEIGKLGRQKIRLTSHDLGASYLRITVRSSGAGGSTHASFRCPDQISGHSLDQYR